MVGHLDVLGTAEVAALLGVSKQRVKQMTDLRILPTPQNLAAGPIWDGWSMREFVNCWERIPGRPPKDRPLKWRYVEVTYQTGLHVRWRSLVVRAATADDALTQAADSILEQYPHAFATSEFLQRTVTEATARQILSQIQDGAWVGWFDSPLTA